jgi:hypothetical protein
MVREISCATGSSACRKKAASRDASVAGSIEVRGGEFAERPAGVDEQPVGHLAPDLFALVTREHLVQPGNGPASIGWGGVAVHDACAKFSGAECGLTHF